MSKINHNLKTAFVNYPLFDINSDLISPSHSKFTPGRVLQTKNIKVRPKLPEFKLLSPQSRQATLSSRSFNNTKLRTFASSEPTPIDKCQIGIQTEDISDYFSSQYNSLAPKPALKQTNGIKCQIPPQPWFKLTMVRKQGPKTHGEYENKTIEQRLRSLQRLRQQQKYKLLQNDCIKETTPQVTPTSLTAFATKRPYLQDDKDYVFNKYGITSENCSSVESSMKYIGDNPKHKHISNLSQIKKTTIILSEPKKDDDYGKYQEDSEDLDDSLRICLQMQKY